MNGKDKWIKKQNMKTAEQKAKEYADSIHPAFVPEIIVENTVTDLNKFAQTDYLAGYYGAMRWRDPKEELPEPGVDVFVKIERKDGDWVNILYTTSAVVNDSFHNKDNNPFICEGYLTSIHSTSVYDGRVKITVIGWKPIE